MPQCKRTRVSRVADLISALPDVLLHQILGLLQAREAVQTCVLGRRWRNLWKSMPELRVTGASPVESLQEFMDHLLLLRDRSGLDVCMFEFGKYLSVHVSYLNLWIRHALLCQVRELDVAVFGSCRMVNELALDNLPVVSQYLAKLNLRGLSLDYKFLDFSSCPALKDLNLTKCNIFCTKISSQSLESLGIQDCKFLWDDCRSHISTPSPITLKIKDNWGLTPSFGEMPALLRAIVKLGHDCFDSCQDDLEYCDEASCWNCYRTADGSAGCVLLKSLSAARSLELIAEPKTLPEAKAKNSFSSKTMYNSVEQSFPSESLKNVKVECYNIDERFNSDTHNACTLTFIFRRDVRWCPTFSKLKTLLLSAWCVDHDLRALICILQHTPVLEMLTLQLSQYASMHCI
ncbi:hypothetical protein EJB05_28872, partial [Eragrostis curvula]